MISNVSIKREIHITSAIKNTELKQTSVATTKSVDEISLMFNRSGRTKENFVQKATERIQYIKFHSEGLKETFEQYSKVQRFHSATNKNETAMFDFLLTKPYDKQTMIYLRKLRKLIDTA